jgi:hypothetical protein
MTYLSENRGRIHFNVNERLDARTLSVQPTSVECMFSMSPLQILIAKSCHVIYPWNEGLR